MSLILFASRDLNVPQRGAYLWLVSFRALKPNVRNRCTRHSRSKRFLYLVSRPIEWRQCKDRWSINMNTKWSLRFGEEGYRLGKSRVFLFGRAPYNFVKLSVNSYIVDRTHKYRITTWIQNSGDTEHARPTYHAAFKVEYQTLSWSNSQPTCLCVTILFIVWFRSQLGLRLFWADPRWRNPPSVRVRCTRRTDRSDRSRSRSSTVDQIDHDLYNLL